MTLREKLGEMQDTLVTVAQSAPDDYSEWLLEYFPDQTAIHEHTMNDLKESWSEIRLRIKKDLVKADYIGVKLGEMMDAFNECDNVEGKKIARELADLYDITKLK
jgi:hypothetical protein